MGLAKALKSEHSLAFWRVGPRLASGLSLLGFLLRLFVCGFFRQPQRSQFGRLRVAFRALPFIVFAHEFVPLMGLDIRGNSAARIVLRFVCHRLLSNSFAPGRHLVT